MAARVTYEDLSGAARRAVAGVSGWLQAVTTLGWSVLALGAAAWLAGVLLGWRELLVVAGACLVVLALAALFTLGGRTYRVGLELSPERVTVGQEAIGEITVGNDARSPSLPGAVEVPVGVGVARLDVPALAPNAEHSEIFLVPTKRRAIIPVGPASVVRGDPLGIMRREVQLAQALALFVHPKVAPVSTAGSGLVRDLEGAATNDITNSDVAFHALRDYVPGDDRRHVHWRSSAKTGRLLVRQFMDTRRSHLLVLLDGQASGYATDEEFELAVSVAASLGVQALRDGQSLTVLACGKVLPAATTDQLLDGFSGVEVVDRGGDLDTMARRAVRLAPNVSLTVLVGGSHTPGAAVSSASRRVGGMTPRAFVRAAEGSTGAFGVTGGVRTLKVGELRDITRGMRVVTSA